MLNERSLCMAIIDYTRTHKLTTLAPYISALANWYHELNLGDLPRDRLFSRVMAGLHNVFGLTDTTIPKAALSLSQLAIIYKHMNHTSYTDIRDWCAYVLAFFGLLRIHEYISPTFQHQHVKPHRWGITIIIAFSKTNLQPVKIRLVKRHDIFDPVHAVLSYLLCLPSSHRLPHLPFFLTSPTSLTSLSDKVFIANFKHRVQYRLHADPTQYAGHSFRRGGTTALFLAGIPETIIASHGRWKSLTYRKYFDATINTLLPTQLLSNKDKGKYPSL